MNDVQKGPNAVPVQLKWQFGQPAPGVVGAIFSLGPIAMQVNMTPADAQRAIDDWQKVVNEARSGLTLPTAGSGLIKPA